MKVIIAVPGETAVTKPVLLTVTNAGFEVDHGFVVEGFPEPTNCDVTPTQMEVVPVIVGSGLINTVPEALVLTQPVIVLVIMTL